MIQLCPYNLSFVREQSHLEADFQTSFFKKNLTHLRFCHYLSIIFLSTWTFIDIAFYSKSIALFSMIKYCIIIPIFLLGLMFTYTKHYRRWNQVISGMYVVLVGLGFNVMIILTSSTDIHPLIFGITICYIFNYTLIRSRFITAVIAGWIILGFSLLSLFLFKDNLPLSDVISISFYLGILNILGMIVSYTMELTFRREFYLTAKLEAERDYQMVLNNKLKCSHDEIKTLRSILPTCSNCKKIRTNGGDWQQLDVYIIEHTSAQFSHGICPDCKKRLYPNLIDAESNSLN